MTKRGPREKLLWHAYDLFGTHHSVTCPSCGQGVRDGYGERRENRLRRLIELSHERTIARHPGDLTTETAEGFIAGIAKLAEHALGVGSGQFMRERLTVFVEALDDHEES